MTNKQAKAFLRKHKACDAALDWFGAQDPRTAWETCHNPDWMEWIATRCGLWTDATRDTYDAAVKLARGAYDAARCDAIRSLVSFDEIAKAIEKEATQ